MELFVAVLFVCSQAGCAFVTEPVAKLQAEKACEQTAMKLRQSVLQQVGPQASVVGTCIPVSLGVPIDG